MKHYWNCQASTTQTSTAGGLQVLQGWAVEPTKIMVLPRQKKTHIFWNIAIGKQEIWGHPKVSPFFLELRQGSWRWLKFLDEQVPMWPMWRTLPPCRCLVLVWSWMPWCVRFVMHLQPLYVCFFIYVFRGEKSQKTIEAAVGDMQLLNRSQQFDNSLITPWLETLRKPHKISQDVSAPPTKTDPVFWPGLEATHWWPPGQTFTGNSSAWCADRGGESLDILSKNIT